LASWILNWQ